MSNLQVKDVPPALHRKLRRLAEEEGRTLRDVVLEALQRDLQRREFGKRLAKRPAAELSEGAGEALRHVRSERGAAE